MSHRKCRSTEGVCTSLYHISNCLFSNSVNAFSVQAGGGMKVVVSAKGEAPTLVLLELGVAVGRVLEVVIVAWS